MTGRRHAGGRPRKGYDAEVKFGTRKDIKNKLTLHAKALGMTVPDLLNMLVERELCQNAQEVVFQAS